MTSPRALFSPIKVGTSTLTHRVVLAPLTRFRAIPEAVPTDLQVEYYKQRASEGGLLVTEATFISRLAGGYPQAPGIYNKEQIEGWKKVTSAVHSKGGVIFLQLWHIGRVGSKYLNPNQEQVVSASDIPCPGKTMQGGEYEVPHALTVDEIKSIVDEYAQAAKNAIEARFDGVEIHGANGYLVDQFLNSSSNNRTDAYGGSVENRSRFALEVIDAVAEAVGEERTAIRLSPGGAFQGIMATENVEENWGYLVKELQQKRPELAYLHLIESRADSLDPQKKNTEDTLESYRKLWKGPFITAGGFSTSLEFADEIAEKTGNLVSYGRAFIANPDLPERLRNGWELNPYDRNTFYSHEAEGYTDYPFYNEKK
ncbi:N-ethylmaleimide reductase [Mucor circinelloides 1006PhL]|uniref:N-ethylmaleimide reductase n=1 Tax=Mucor circinelloides f. circinelloides (strain 1006PhL) TaxID=1220926 RepID=S2JUG8_MUCC1|nr:N-ethylmaleimide reductase [Mucor circinelloides 1006PhL]